jgi:predicted phage terminase large subunit-like protein
MRSSASRKRSATTRRDSNGRSLPSLAAMAQAELNRIRAAKTERTIQAAKPYLPHQPSLKQSLFLSLTCEEALYGGAGGGGKSDALLMGALQYVDVPGYSAILFRRTQTDLDLPNAILNRARTWWEGTAASWDADIHGFRFPTQPGKPDATIAFGYLRTEADKYRYKSAEFQYIGFDELTQFTETQYRYLFSRLRRPHGMPVPLRMRGATNPGDVGHEWVKARFVKHAREVAPDHFVSPPSPEVLEVARELGRRADGAHWVRSFARDNPGLDVGSYRMQLARLDPLARSHMEHGDWEAAPGGEHFRRTWFTVIAARPVLGWKWVRYWDLAATEPHEGNPDPDWTAGALVGMRYHANGDVDTVIADVVRFRAEPGEVLRRVKETAARDGKRVPVWIEEEPGSAGKNNTRSYQTAMPGYDVQGHKKTGDKPSYWRPLAAQAQAGNVSLVDGPWVEDFLGELTRLPHGKKDQADAAAGGFDRLLEDRGAARTRLLVGG